MREKPIEDFFSVTANCAARDNLMVHDLMLVEVKKRGRGRNIHGNYYKSWAKIAGEDAFGPPDPAWRDGEEINRKIVLLIVAGGERRGRRRNYFATPPILRMPKIILAVGRDGSAPAFGCGGNRVRGGGFTGPSPVSCTARFRPPWQRSRQPIGRRPSVRSSRA